MGVYSSLIHVCILLFVSQAIEARRGVWLPLPIPLPPAAGGGGVADPATDATTPTLSTETTTEMTTVTPCGATINGCTMQSQCTGAGGVCGLSATDALRMPCYEMACSNPAPTTPVCACTG